FFFSSRRRHTRFSRDWSSDVCSSDLEDYANWTLAHIVRTPAFVFAPEKPGGWHEPYPGWQATRYEQKARREGRMISFYFSFTREIGRASCRERRLIQSGSLALSRTHT